MDIYHASHYSASQKFSAGGQGVQSNPYTSVTGEECLTRLKKISCGKTVVKMSQNENKLEIKTCFVTTSTNNSVDGLRFDTV